MGVVLIGGGARSGKSRFALDYAQKRFRRPALIATAQALDRDMKERILRHQAERDPAWSTIEEPIEITAAMAREAGRFDVFVVDCLTLWLSNILHQPNGDARAEIEKLKGYLERPSETATVLVSKSPNRGVLYFLRPDAAVDVDVSQPALDKAQQSARDFFAAQSQQRFPLQVGKHCFRCAHYGNLCPARVAPE